MLPMLATPASPSARHDVKTCIALCGAQDGLQMILDAGSDSSYDGSSQTWTDDTGNGNDFWRGSSSSSQSIDPTFNGTVGRRSENEYFSSNGDDLFTAKTFASWMRDFVKTSATPQMMYIGYDVHSASEQTLISTMGAASTTFGFNLHRNTITNGWAVSYRSSADAFKALTASATLGSDGRHGTLVGYDFSELVQSYISSVNRYEATISSSKDSKNANPTSGTMRLWVRGGVDGVEVASGHQCNCIAMWSEKHTWAEQVALWMSIMGKYGFDMAT
jgi:hypothetical protein